MVRQIELIRVLGSRHKTGRIARQAGPDREHRAGLLVPIDLGLPRRVQLIDFIAVSLGLNNL